MRSRRSWLRALAGKEWRELLASRAWWLFLLLMGPLVGVSFIDAVRTYAEASGLHGTAVGVGEAFSPLIGVWAPTFSACELAAAFLWPFVAIRLVGGDRQSGALAIELQHGSSTCVRVGVKAVVLLAAWTIASAAPLLAVGLWTSYGGSIYVPELLSVAFGHVLNAALTAGLGAAAAALTEHPSTAAIVTLGATVGTWILNFAAAVHGGIWERAAGYTPTAVVAQLQHGLIRLDVVLVTLAFIVALLAVCAVWMRLGAPIRERLLTSAAIAAATTAVVLAAGAVRASWDVSESRVNSFSRADERALQQIREPLTILVHLAPEDPRRADLDRRTLSKLARVMPSLDVRYESATSIGLFEQTNPHYGEIEYSLSGRTMTSRSTTPEGVLECIYELADVTPDAEDEADIFRGHPLAAPPKGAAIVFYGLWPVLAAGAFLKWRRGS